MEGIFLLEKTSVTLRVFHDGQFFTALFERNDENGFSAARTVFAAKPSDNDILALILSRYGALRYSPAVKDGSVKPLAANPKRRQREAARAAQRLIVSTKAQQALSAQHQQAKATAKALSSQKRKQTDDERFAQRQQKRKQKHKGR